MPAALLITDIVALTVATVPSPLPLGYGVLLGTVAVAGLFGTARYRPRLTLSVIDELPAICGAALAATLVASTTAAVTHPGLVWLAFRHGAAVLVSVVAGRTVSYTVIRTARRRGWTTHRTLVVGTGEVGIRLGRALQEHPEYGLRVVGFVGRPGPLGDALPAELLGDGSALPDAARRHDVSVVIIAFGGVSADELVDALRGGPAPGCTVFVVPRLFEVLRSSHIERVRDIPLIRMRRPPCQTGAWRLKRLVDVVVAATALVLLSPVLLVTACAVRLECGRGVLFRQRRVGRDGQTFTVLKFRSIQPADQTESATRWTVSDDERLGRVGQFIRRTSLDELPQLLNVLRGDMSLVGPRPERPYFVGRFRSRFRLYDLRHRVPPGITGWAAVNGLRGDTSIEERIYYDNVYIENWSLWLDLKILLQTVAAVLGARGA